MTKMTKLRIIPGVLLTVYQTPCCWTSTIPSLCVILPSLRSLTLGVALSKNKPSPYQNLHYSLHKTSISHDGCCPCWFWRSCLWRCAHDWNCPFRRGKLGTPEPSSLVGVEYCIGLSGCRRSTAIHLIWTWSTVLGKSFVGCRRESDFMKLWIGTWLVSFPSLWRMH